MTGKQLAHMENVLTRFNRDYRDKYVRGQAEHGGLLSEKPSMLAHARAEVLDLVSYLDVVQQQLRALSVDLRSGDVQPSVAADMIDRMLT